jgi:hypothetical protein
MMVAGGGSCDVLGDPVQTPDDEDSVATGIAIER